MRGKAQAGVWITRNSSGKIKDSHKIGHSVSGSRAVVHSKGKEIHGKVVYKRKADYSEDPFKKRA